jgi:polyphosphate glucokinase
MQILGVDMGGSGIKGAMVDLDSGELASERIRIKTPSDFEIDAVTEAIAALVAGFDYRGAVGTGFRLRSPMAGS